MPQKKSIDSFPLNSWKTAAGNVSGAIYYLATLPSIKTPVFFGQRIPCYCTKTSLILEMQQLLKLVFVLLLCVSGSRPFQVIWNNFHCLGTRQCKMCWSGSRQIYCLLRQWQSFWNVSYYFSFRVIWSLHIKLKTKNSEWCSRPCGVIMFKFSICPSIKPVKEIIFSFCFCFCSPRES